MTTVREELVEIAGIEQKENESWSKFANRLVRTIDKKEIPEEEWSQLSPEAQTWFNSAVESITAETDIRSFPGEEPEPATKGNKGTKEKKAKEPKGEGNGRPKKLTDDQTITIVSEKNPKRPGSRGAAMFDMYKDGMTVKQALDAGVTRSNLNWDVDKGFIRVE